MSAHKLLAAACLAAALPLALAGPARAQSGQGGFKVNLTEAPEPDSVAWEDPARISLTIDPNGPDRFSAQVNLELEWWRISPLGRPSGFGGNLVWNRESGGDDRQNNLEAGMFYSIGYNPALLSQRGNSTPEQQENFVDFSSRFSLDYARTANYPDLASPTCVATPTVRQCRTQFKESVRGGAAFTLFAPFLENQGPTFAYSIAPKLGVDYDHLFNNPLNAAGAEISGGYLSARAGLAVTIVPRFDARDFELSGSVQLRQRIFASDSRRPLIEGSAFLFQASATYYLVTPTEEDGWRAGIGITYTRGDDPLNGRSNVNRIVLALRIGRY